MDEALLRQLAEITLEEQRLLDGGELNMSDYGSEKNSVRASKLLPTNSLITLRAHTRFVRFPRHCHDFVEIMYVCSGSVTHLFGRQKITVNAGELLFLGRNAMHEILCTGEGDIAVNLLIRPAFFRTAFDLMDEQSILSDYIITCLTGEGSADEFLHFAVADRLPVQNLVENLVWSLCRGGDERIDRLTMGLLFLRLLEDTGCVTASGGTPRTIALRALSYIEEHYQNATLRAFAAENQVAEYAASRIIKAQLGQSFRHLLMEKRFSSAVTLLCTTDLPAEDILASAGYENTSYFYRIFRERYGVSPREYRRKNKG